jgi:hypothetical protein
MNRRGSVGTTVSNAGASVDADTDPPRPLALCASTPEALVPVVLMSVLAYTVTRPPGVVSLQRSPSIRI